MTRELLVELLLTATARPHAKCLRKIHKALGQTRHYALARPGKPSTASADPLLKNRKPSDVPLAVGIDRNPKNLSAISQIPIPKGVKDENFVPSVLAIPLGLRSPPRPGENSPEDKRSWRERQQEFANPERAMERRQVYLRTFLRPYFQEWKRIDKEYKGKSFVSNDRLFRKDKALYFPNMWGQTLAKDGSKGKDTTTVLKGKISIVGIQSNQWAEEMVNTFLSSKANPELQTLLERNPTRLQRADVNVQNNILSMWLVKLFAPNLRRMIPEDRWDKYFMVKLPRDIRLGLTDEVRDAMGFLNTSVGYVYLLDQDCKIRWAGSGLAWNGEVDNLNSGIRRLLADEVETPTRPRRQLPAYPNILPENVPNPAMAAAI